MHVFRPFTLLVSTMLRPHEGARLSGALIFLLLGTFSLVSLSLALPSSSPTWASSLFLSPYLSRLCTLTTTTPALDPAQTSTRPRPCPRSCRRRRPALPCVDFAIAHTPAHCSSSSFGEFDTRPTPQTEEPARPTFGECCWSSDAPRSSQVPLPSRCGVSSGRVA